MEFVTVDGKLEIKENTIIQKRLTNVRKRNIFIYVSLFIFFLNLLMNDIDKLNEKGIKSVWFGIMLNVLIILFYVAFVITILFRQVLSNKVDIDKITEVKLTDSEEGLDKNVLLKTKSNRYKLYKFRILEMEYEKLVDYLVEQKPDIKIVREKDNRRHRFGIL